MRGSASELDPITMAATITLEEAQAHLREWTGNLVPGEELVIIDKSFERRAD